MAAAVTLLYFDDCPNWQIARDRLDSVRSRHALDLTVDYRRVTTDEEARRLTFRGSPTILVDGTDPFADPDAPVGLSCRIYQTADGPQGAPCEQQIEEALGL